MSHFQGLAFNPLKEKVQNAQFFDDHFGPSQYGVSFGGDEIYPIFDVATLQDMGESSYMIFYKTCSGQLSERSLSQDFQGFFVKDEELIFGGISLDDACRDFIEKVDSK